MNDGFILLSRTLLDSDVFASQKLLKIWIWCLCKANFKDRSVPLKVGKGETIVKVKRGSFIFGRYKAEEELFIDGSTIYKSIQKLQKMDMIKIDSNNQYSIITICKYDEYQQSDNYQVTAKEQPSNNEVTAKGQPSNTTKNDNNYNKDKNENKILHPPEIDFDKFLKWFNQKRKAAGYKNSNINILQPNEKQFIRELRKYYTLEDFDKAFDNMIKNGWAKSNDMVLPKHFVNPDNFIKYLNTRERTLGEKLIDQ